MNYIRVHVLGIGDFDGASQTNQGFLQSPVVAIQGKELETSFNMEECNENGRGAQQILMAPGFKPPPGTLWCVLKPHLLATSN